MHVFLIIVLTVLIMLFSFKFKIVIHLHVNIKKIKAEILNFASAKRAEETVAVLVAGLH